MRIICHSDDPLWTTGFGRELHQIMWRLKRARPDWDIGALHWNHHGAPFATAYGYQLLPDLGSGHFENARFFIERFQPDIYLTLYDIFVSGAFMPSLSQKAGLLQNPPQPRKTKWLSYFVFDIERWSAPRSWQNIFNTCDIPVAMTKYGQDSVLENFGVETRQIYHGVDAESFPPLKQSDIDKRRDQWGNPDFVLGAFFRNIHRKQTARLLQAWSRISREYRDVKLLMNMKLQDNQGFDLAHYMHHFNLLALLNEKLEPLEKGPIIIGDQMSETWGVPLEELNMYYQASDAQILPTMGEGFGKPITEGYAACGLPVIMSRNTTYNELVGDHGLPIECEGYVWSRHEGAQPLPSLRSMEDQIRIMIDDRKQRRKFAEYNKQFALKFDYEKEIIPKWIQLLEGEQASASTSTPTPLSAETPASPA